MTAPPGAAAVEDAVAAVRPRAAGDDPRAVFAAGAWTVLAEPGDRVAGALVASMGAADALEAVRMATPPVTSRELRDGFARWRIRLDEEVLLRAFRNAAHLGIRLLVPGDPDWPAGLDDLGQQAPIALWALAPPGPMPDLARSVAVVGTRTPTAYGRRVATELAAGLADRGFAVVSGAAYGIDGVAHRGALTNGGLTAAVLGGGLDRLYPSGHADLLRRIAAEGAVLSEYPCGSTPNRWRFLDRNRLIAAIGRATVVVEAAHRSGALSTAGHAASLARPLGAVPGSVHSALSAGCHRVLREYGGTAVRDAADAAELAAGPGATPEPDGLEAPRDPVEQRVLDVLTRASRPVAELARRAGLSPADATAALGMLTLTGDAREAEGGWRRP